jgi:NAD(P)-dependent dehydrogenase (short-subunit alcohol dehydrogenase family)
MKTMADRTVLVTGAAKRLGREIALYFAREGWNTIIHYGQSVQDALAVVDEIRGLGVKAIALQANLSRHVEAESLIQKSIDHFYRIDCLVNSAAIFEYDRPSQDDHPVSADLIERHAQINLVAPVVMAQALFRHLKSQPISKAFVPATIQLLDQKLINLNPDYFSYTLSKSALLTATEMMARDFAPYMRSVGLAPGITLPSADQSQSEFEKAHQVTPMGYSSSPYDISSAAFFLANAKSITGTTLYVDGGQHLLASDRDVMFKFKK